MITVQVEGPIRQTGDMLEMPREEREFETWESALAWARVMSPDEWHISEQPNLNEIWVML